jgi:GxxExxY protein
MEPQMNADERRLSHITEAVIGCAYEVGNQLGCGFLEKLYENAMFVELTRSGLVVEQQRAIQVRYKGVVVGEYIADLIVAGEIVVELKAVKDLDEIHTAQCLNYLKATGLKVCLLINFGKSRVEVKRLVNKL